MSGPELAAPATNPQSLSRAAGRLELHLGRDARGVTVPLRSLAQPPLQLSRVRYDDPACPETATLTLLHLGGVLAGDRVQMHVALEAGAGARIQMAAATQVLRMPDGCAAHKLEITLAEDSRLDWLAEPLILFGGARFSQQIHVTLGCGARLALMDILVPGRLARGECDAFERYETRLDVCDGGGRLLMAERGLLEPRRRALAVPGIRGSTPVVGSLYLLGDQIDATQLAAQLHILDDARLGVSELPNHSGVLVRLLDATPSAARERLHAIRRRVGIMI